MKKTLIASAVAAAIVAGPALAQQKPTTGLDQIRRELGSLSERLEKLEQDKQKLEADNAALKAQNERLEATTEYLKSNAQATRKDLAEDAVQVEKIAGLEKTSKASEWASKLAWKGDLRYRHENVDAEAATPVPEQTRHRVRARFGLTAKVNDTLSATVQVATNGGNNDPRSTNQTLGEGNARKGVALDLAYAEWKPATGLAFQLGKTPYSITRVGSYFWDGDITWEGLNAKYERGLFFGNAFGYWLQESSNSSDANVVGAQVGFKTTGDVKFTGAVGYYDVGAVQDEITTTAGTCTANNTFFGGPQGNQTYTGAGCARLLNDYNLIEAIAQVELKLGSLPLAVFANYIQNNEADDEDTGIAGGITLGKASDPRTWEIGYVYQDLDKNAQFGQFVDSDFGGGITGSKGHVIRGAYAVAKGWTVNGAYLKNERRTGNALNAPLFDYDRYQIDLNFKF